MEMTQPTGVTEFSLFFFVMFFLKSVLFSNMALTEGDEVVEAAFVDCRFPLHICWGEKLFERLSQSCSGHMLQRFCKNAKNASVFLSLSSCPVAGGWRGRALALEM